MIFKNSSVTIEYFEIFNGLFSIIIIFLLRWVPFEIAKPLLDRKPYMVLSDFTTQNGGSLPSSVLDTYVEEQPDDHVPGGSNDIFLHVDEEMAEYDSENSDDEEDTESSSNVSDDLEDGDVGNVLIGLTGVHLRYKVNSHRSLTLIALSIPILSPLNLIHNTEYIN